MNADNVTRLARLERMVRIIMACRTRATDALLDFTTPALNPPSRYLVNRDRADRLGAQYAQEWRSLSQVAR